MSDFEKLTKDLVAMVPAPVTKALVGLLILVVGLFIVKILSNVFKKMIGRISILKNNKLVSPLTTLFKAILTIFVLIATLQHFGLTSVLAPLELMLAQFLSVIPNIIGAGVVGYAGWLIAKLVSELVGVALEKLDKQIALKTGNHEIKVSTFGSAFVFAVVLLPIIVAALGVLNIPSISVPASNMINELMSTLPNIVGAGIILTVAYFCSRFIVFLVSGILIGLGINELPKKLALDGFFTETFTPIKLVEMTIMFFTMLTATVAAVETLGIPVVSQIFEKILSFGGGILVGTIILIIGNFLGTLVYQRLVSSGSHALAGVAKVAVLGLVLAMGLRSMGLAENIVNMAFGFSIGAVSVAFALAFGLGGRDSAKELADRWVSKLK